MGPEQLEMQDYLDGTPQQELNKSLASLLGFMSLDRFKAPAMLIAVEYYTSFLTERELINSSAQTKTRSAVAALDRKLRRIMKDEWDTIRFLDRLCPVEA